MNTVDRTLSKRTQTNDKKSDEMRPDWIPAREYLDPSVPLLEKERLWPRVWQIACRESELKEVGDYVAYQIIDDSILVVRTGKKPDDIIAMYNVCQHRGRKLITNDAGNLGGQIGCKFHGWQYSIEGKNVHVPFREDWKGCTRFEKASLDLPRVKVARWGGWVWINQDEKAESLQDYLGVIPELVDPFELENTHALWWKTLNAPINWKVVLEAFNESYHAIPTHNSAIIYSMRSPSKAHGRHGSFWFDAPEAPTRYRTEKGKWVTAKSGAEAIWAAHKVLDDMLFAMTLEPTMEATRRLKAEAPKDASGEYLMKRLWELQQDEYAQRKIKLPKNLTMEAAMKAGVSWHIFPNAIVLPTVDGALWYRFRPHRTDPDACSVDLWSFGRFAPGKEPNAKHETYDDLEAFKGQNPFLEEDFPNILAANEGMKIRGWKGARTNPVQEAPVNNFHRNLADYLSKP
jgi:phenylpropionate dioxygenase-like ring-hydroxylating dioxygenase large terminal subunit